LADEAALVDSTIPLFAAGGRREVWMSPNIKADVSGKRRLRLAVV